MLALINGIVNGPHGTEVIFALSVIAMWVGIVQGYPSIRALVLSPILTFIVMLLVWIFESLVVDPLTKPMGHFFSDAVGWLIGAVLCVVASHRVGRWAGEFAAEQTSAPEETRHRRGAVVSAGAPPGPRRRWGFGSDSRQAQPRSGAPALAGVPDLERIRAHFLQRRYPAVDPGWSQR